MSGIKEKRKKVGDVLKKKVNAISKDVPPGGWQVKARKDIVPERKYGFETAPEPIRTRDIREAITADVVVVGAGLAGLSAVLSAAEAGARTVLIEKTNTYQARGHHHAFIDSKLQKKLGIEIDKDEVILNLIKHSANKADQRLIRMWVEGTHKTADWLIDMADAAGLGVSIFQYPPPPSYKNSDEYYPQYLVTHIFGDGARSLAKCMTDNAVKKGVAIHFRTTAKQLLRKKNKRVTGLIALDKAGDYIQYNARKAVVLCTGDYAYNSEMMAKYCPQSAYLASMLRTSTGDGHQMAMWIGAVMEPAPHAPIIHGPAGPLSNSPFLQVNIKGERFYNEDVPVQSYVNAAERQPGQAVWQVFDSKYPEEAIHMGIGLGKVIEVTEDTRRHVEKQSLIDDTVEGLAEKMKVPVEAFTATVARYNELARMGKDLDFGKRPDRLTTIDKPPYYAGRGRYTLLVVNGGLNVNPRLQALDKNWEPIPGLYLAGNTMGNRFAVDYPTMCPGLSHGMALHYGRVAGLNACSLEPWQPVVI
ncbi:MAG: FAD-dependent oxidoreductase [Deltaproteobacteria bacterium]|nr:FAD-dependent oxidoreductase [Deltaproteobacteria bacterium]